MLPAHRAAPPAAAPRPTGRSATLRLPGSSEGCAQAREFTERVLGEWELGQCRDDALTVVSELAANAVLHGRKSDTLDDGESEVWLRLTRRTTHLVCAVTDQGDGLPHTAHAPKVLSEHGRGLFIVEALAQHWGWTRHTPHYKTVWAMLPTGRA
ncbi:ATP-binding protein [Streptomyces sp. WM6386]|uniref:ATP-binding protein n=1 Tax=Streptomyces sp. WM6386 TaxID=1415558 RepID=UPI00061F2BE4|nr:ATP-binding protein [Streptomyces sp. WM6386]KKD07705.1 regulator [Streptomyces sp. WM6386]